MTLDEARNDLLDVLDWRVIDLATKALASQRGFPLGFPRANAARLFADTIVRRALRMPRSVLSRPRCIWFEPEFDPRERTFRPKESIDWYPKDGGGHDD
jgi:hypothetical protein